MNEISWDETLGQFEAEMAVKLQNLPDHREVPANLKKLRHLISHELPETASAAIYEVLIGLLLKGKSVDLLKINKKYLKPEIIREKQRLGKFKKEFEELRKLAMKWVEGNYSDKELKDLWEKHKTWLPRRYTIYKKKVSLQKIAADALVRFALLK